MRFFTGKIVLSVFLITLTLSAAPVNPGYLWKINELNTAVNSEYLSAFEKEVILEINRLRSNPAQYAIDFIEPLQKCYSDRMFYYPGDLALMTQEGVGAMIECIRFLKTQQSVDILKPNNGLSLAAKDLVNDQSVKGGTGHKGHDQSGFRERIERHGDWGIRIAENITYGKISPRQVVIYLLIDDGIGTRGHRTNFLNKDFRIIGVATGKHPYYENMCVMEFAGEFQNFASK